MRNLITYSLVLSLILLSSCSIDWNDEKDKKILELQKQVQDDTFKKKQECGKITKEEIVNKWKDKFIILPSNIKEIFYSKKMNSCIYTINETNLWGIYDYYSGEIILESDSPLKSGSGEIEINFQEKVRELKGECSSKDPLCLFQ